MDSFFDLFQGDSPYFQLVGEWAYKAYDKRELLFMYSHLMVAALLPIYTGAHSSLRCPPSAALAPKAAGT